MERMMAVRFGLGLARFVNPCQRQAAWHSFYSSFVPSPPVINTPVQCNLSLLAALPVTLSAELHAHPFPWRLFPVPSPTQAPCQFIFSSPLPA
jgi:hypothetical protein